MRTSNEHTTTTDSHEACTDCGFEGWVDMHHNYATGLTYWECVNGHGHQGEISHAD